MLSVPREWVHDCDHDTLVSHQDHDHDHDQDENDARDISFDSEDCFACDYSLSSYSLHQFSDFSVNKFHYFKKDLLKANGPLTDFNVTHSLRGPPSIELS